MKRHQKRLVALIAVIIPLLLLVGMIDPGHAAPKQRNIILATTTSTQDSGLLDVLLPIFEKKTGYFVKTIAVGSGQAMAMGRKGEADVLLVHSPAEEKKFMAEGNGVNRRLVMHNDFIIVGPAADPATIKMSTTSVGAFKKISLANAPFMSRGDNSGTHSKEKAIWKKAGINPELQKWYQQTGLGMGQTLNVAAEKKAYTPGRQGHLSGPEEEPRPRDPERRGHHAVECLFGDPCESGEIQENKCRRRQGLCRVHGGSGDPEDYWKIRHRKVRIAALLP